MIGPAEAGTHNLGPGNALTMSHNMPKPLSLPTASQPHQPLAQAPPTLTPTQGAGSDPTPPTQLKALHILLVEDSPDNQLLIRSYVKQTPYRLDIADQGAIALEQFKKNDYDLILMDMQMPVMDGYDTTRAIRAWEREHHRPPAQVIALTALAHKEDGGKILEAGCNAHMTKPIKKQALLEILQACTGRSTS
ncbi:MAG: response regulator [Nitrospirae bacterium]|nr:response regulator [Nitrospirota bacterium]